MRNIIVLALALSVSCGGVAQDRCTSAGSACSSQTATGADGGGNGGARTGSTGGASSNLTGGAGGTSNFNGAGGAVSSGGSAGGAEGGVQSGGRASIPDAGMMDAHVPSICADGADAAPRQVSFAKDVQPIFTAKCATAGCHSSVDPNIPPEQGMDLEPGSALLSILNVRARDSTVLGEPNLRLVDSTTTDISASYIWRKVSGEGNRVGSVEPPASSGLSLSKCELSIIADWIQESAPNN